MCQEASPAAGSQLRVGGVRNVHEASLGACHFFETPQIDGFLLASLKTKHQQKGYPEKKRLPFRHLAEQNLHRRDWRFIKQSSSPGFVHGLACGFCSAGKPKSGVVIPGHAGKNLVFQGQYLLLTFGSNPDRFQALESLTPKVVLFRVSLQQTDDLLSRLRRGGGKGARARAKPNAVKPTPQRNSVLKPFLLLAEMHMLFLLPCWFKENRCHFWT